MNKLLKLLNVVIYLCIMSYALPTGVMMGIPIQKILVCLLIILGGISLIAQRKSFEIIKNAKHLPQIESPEQVLEAVNIFFAS